MKNQIWKECRGKNIDFVQVCDLDEVLSAENMLQELKNMKMNGYTVWKSKCYECVSEEFPQHRGDTLVHQKDGVYLTYSYTMSKNILFNPNEIEDMNYCEGAHESNPKGRVKWSHSEAIKMYHLKNLSIEYVLQKYHAGAERLSRLNKSKGWGVQYLYEDDKIRQDFNDLLNRHI